MKIKNKIIFISLLIVYFSSIFSCENPVEKPKDLIDKSDFIAVLTDLYLYKNINPQMLDNRSPNYTEIYGYILNTHKVNANQFTESFNYYMINEKASKDILEKVNNNLTKKAKELGVKIKPPREETYKEINSLNYR